MAAHEEYLTALSKNVIQAFDDLNGVHPGYRPAHAKGIFLTGTFIPSPQGKTLTRAPHLLAASTPVTVRFSDFAGIPTVADNDPNGASPRGIAIRFHLGEHTHTDIIAHSVDGFPTRTAEEFVEFLHAVHASGPGAPKPAPIEVFLGSHPSALEFVQAPKPIPTSFAKESFYGVNALKYTNAEDISRYGRIRIHPEAGNEYLSTADTAAKSANFLFEEIRERVAKEPIKLIVTVQLAAEEDVVDDSTIHWPADRPIVELGTVELTNIAADGDEEKLRIIFDPIPRVDGIDPSGDPLLEPRAAVYLMAGHRRRAAGPK